ncbi:MAG TPA: HEAT repeat domain-containing protein [Candidatus Omnitrophota bacterium]|nr:HEAT repeat domain-containing protein [Candidatus Omnitrophota bacterium]
MIDSFTQAAYKIDSVLLWLFVFISFITIWKALRQDVVYKRRNKELVRIKTNVYDMLLSGKAAGQKICLPQIKDITPQQFLDVTTNRNREGVFFNEAEQGLLKDCFVSGEKIHSLKNRALKSFNKWKRIEAILALGYAQENSAVSVFSRSIKSRDTDISYFSIIALGQIHNSESVKILLESVKTKKAFRSKIYSVLENFPKDQVIPEISELLKNNDKNVVVWAIRLVKRSRAAEYFEDVKGLLKDVSADVRAAACECLGEFENKDPRADLIACLEDENWLVRSSSVSALSKLLGKDSLPEIMKKINDGSPYVVESVKKAMTENIGASPPYIDNFLKSSDEIAKRASVEALESSGYVINIFKDVLAEKETAQEHSILKGLIDYRAFAGLEAALSGFKKEEQEKLLLFIKKIDKPAGEIISQNIAGHEILWRYL